MVNRRLDNVNVGDAFLTLVSSEGEWNPPTAQFENTSATQRPGALTFDYRQRFEVGPIERGDTSDGLFSKVWRVRRDGLIFYIARENDTGDDWRAEKELFRIDKNSTLPDEEPDQFGFSFDQNGRPTLSFSLSNEVYIWWFDPQQNQQVIRNLDTGRTPLILLDERRTRRIPISDLLVFYVNSNNEIVFRQQRDRYDTAYSTPIAADETLSLETLYRSFDRRVVCAYTRFDADRAKYNLDFLISVTYGIDLKIESFQSEVELSELSLRKVRVSPDSFEGSSLFLDRITLNDVSIDFVEKIIETPEELATAGIELVSFTQNTVFTRANANNPDEFLGANTDLVDASLATVSVNISTNNPDEIIGGDVQLKSISTTTV